ncbi:MAG: GTP-binding protein [Eisenbergiella sp.]
MGEQKPEKTKKHICAGLLAHVDAGKTTITEQLLLLGGNIRSAGSVDQGTAQTDWMDVERRRGISVKNACAEVPYKDSVIQIVDTPGHVDFAAEVARSLQALDGAVLVISGAEGVQAHTQTIFQALERMKIPTIFAVNKVDRAGFDMDALTYQIGKRLTDRFICLQKVENPACEDCRIVPENDLDDRKDSAAEQIAGDIFEKLAEVDEELGELYLEERKPDRTLLLKKLREYSGTGEIYPVVFLNAKQGKGVRQLADAILEYLPDGFENDSGALQGIVFQVSHDPVMGKAAHIRLFGGKLTSRNFVPIAGQQPEEWEKATQIRKIQGGRFLDTGEMKAGEIAAVYGLSKCRAGDVIGKECDGDLPGLDRKRENLLKIEPLLMVQVVPKDMQKETELSAALTQLSDEDPFLFYERNPLTGQMYLRVMGMVQIEILEELLQSSFGLETSFLPPSVIYKEKPAHEAVGKEVYTMPKPCWAVVELKVEPLPAGSGIVFESLLKEKELPYRYQNHIRQSLMDTVSQGIYGWEVTDAKFTLVGGQSHHVHTHPLDFFVATPVAVLRALTESESMLMEPYVKISLSAAEQFMGKVMGHIVNMRGEFEAPIIEDGMFFLEAVVPLRDSMEYPVTFRSLTSGQGSYSMELDSYRPCEKGFLETLPRRGVNPLDHAKWILSCRSAY